MGNKYFIQKLKNSRDVMRRKVHSSTKITWCRKGLCCALCDLSLHFIMGSEQYWIDLLDARYPSFKIEVEAFLDSCDVSSSFENAANIICEKNRRDQNLQFQERFEVRLFALFFHALWGGC